MAVGEYLFLHNFNAEHDIFSLNNTGNNPVESAYSRRLIEVEIVSI